jgi:TonB family protein
MGQSSRTYQLVLTAFMTALAGAGGCARNPPPATADRAQAGRPESRGQVMGPLFFDPRGADFTAWVNVFKNEVYRNWSVPQSALLGTRGRVDFEFSVERNGAISALRMLKSSGVASLDTASEHALARSRLAKLPAEFGPQRVTMKVSFFYNERPAREPW